MEPQTEPVSSAIQLITWQDIFVVIDDGRARASDYDALKTLVVQLTAAHPRGLGCITIIPPNARPPSEQARNAISAHLELVTLRCLCWCVEGAGFQAGMARAVLASFRLLSHHKYPTKVVSGLEEALAWMLPQLDDGRGRIAQAPAAARCIRWERRAAR
jgi:hypothetical protein